MRFWTSPSSKTKSSSNVPTPSCQHALISALNCRIAPPRRSLTTPCAVKKPLKNSWGCSSGPSILWSFKSAEPQPANKSVATQPATASRMLWEEKKPRPRGPGRKNHLGEDGLKLSQDILGPTLWSFQCVLYDPLLRLDHPKFNARKIPKKHSNFHANLTA